MSRPTIDDSLLGLLACPTCRRALEPGHGALFCSSCTAEYPRLAGGGFDLRPRRYPRVALEVDLGAHLPAEEAYNSSPLPPNPYPEVDFTGVAVPHHLTPEMLTYFPKARLATSAVLDLGCGSAIHRAVCEGAGFRYVGLDYGHPAAPFLGDGHFLPFREGAFEFVLSIAVLEHIRNPFLMMREVARVLAPGGRLVGTVAFLEPFHGNSFYHHTHLGVLNTLHTAGLRAEHISPMEHWDVVAAQSQNGLFPKMPKALARALGWPLQALHRGWWRAALLTGRSTEALRLRSLRRTTGAFCFVAHRDPPRGSEGEPVSRDQPVTTSSAGEVTARQLFDTAL